MLNSKPVDKILFIDIETVPQEQSFFDLSIRKQKLFVERFKKEYNELGLGVGRRAIREAEEITDEELLHENEADDRAKMESLYRNKASLHAEWGKICCISIGFIKPGSVPDGFGINPTVTVQSDVDIPFHVRSFSGEDEVKLLKDFHAATGSLINSTLNPKMSLCAHNGMNFDFPFIGKRMLLTLGVLPGLFDYWERKPWDVTWFIDTKNVWKANVYDNTVSLDMLCELFNVSSSKDDGITGAQVRDVFYEEKDIPKITKYCERDIFALATVYLRMKGIKNQLVSA